MNSFRLILGIGLLVFSVYMIFMNWAVFVNNHLLKRKWTSAVPVVGGFAGMVGMICLPVEGLWKYSWIPLVVDWGTIPVMVVSLVFLRKEKGGTH